MSKEYTEVIRKGVNQMSTIIDFIIVVALILLFAVFYIVASGITYLIVDVWWGLS